MIIAKGNALSLCPPCAHPLNQFNVVHIELLICAMRNEAHFRTWTTTTRVLRIAERFRESCQDMCSEISNVMWAF